MCTKWQERAHSGERSAFCVWANGQPDVCIGHAAFTVIWPQQKSGQEWLHQDIHTTCVSRSSAELLSSEFVLILDVPPPPTVNQSCQCGATQSPPHCYRIWEVHGDAIRSSIWPLEALQLRQTLHMELLATFSNQAIIGF